MIELKGRIILDNETMDNLRDEVRQEIISDIKQNGNYSHEIEEFMNDCDYESYINMIEGTIDNIIKKTNIEDIRFNSELRKWKQLLAIKSLLDIN